MFGYYIAVTGLMVLMMSLLATWDSIYLFITDPDELCCNNHDLLPRERMGCCGGIFGACLIFWGLVAQGIYELYKWI